MQYVVGNWKMHTTVPEAVALAGRIGDGLEDLLRGGAELPQVVICPPFIALSPISDVLDTRTLSLGAQTSHWEPHGSFTGEVAPEQLKGLVEYVMVGHSERRAAAEADPIVAHKLAGIVRAGLTPILCVGETEASPDAEAHTLQQLRDALSEIDPSKIESLLVAYEPVWAIGTGQPAEIGHVTEVVTAIHSELADLQCDAAVLYGGSVDKDNVKDFLDIPDLNGVLVGGASLSDQQFISIVNTVASHG
jgi:triosephosphate isomerase